MAKKAIKIRENFSVRLLGISYPTDKGQEVFDITEKIIKQGAFYNGLVGGPESALMRNGSPDRTYKKFMIGEEYADAFLKELAAITGE